MRRAIKVLGLVLAAALVAFGAAIAFSPEIRAASLFKIAPAFASRRYLVRFESADGQTITLLGTIHTDHLTEPAFGLWHLAAVVEHLHPDVLFVESRPEEIARGNACDGPVEMGFVGLFAKSLAIDVRGMDFWQREAIGAIVHNSEEREDEMFRRAMDQLDGKRGALLLTGFSHIEGFSTRLSARGFRRVEVTSAEKSRLLSLEGAQRPYPAGLAECLERRIDEDTRGLVGETDAGWRSRVERNIAVRRRFLESVRAPR